jgi:hypothetical protein
MLDTAFEISRLKTGHGRTAVCLNVENYLLRNPTETNIIITINNSNNNNKQVYCVGSKEGHCMIPPVLLLRIFCIRHVCLLKTPTDKKGKLSAK